MADYDSARRSLSFPLSPPRSPSPPTQGFPRPSFQRSRSRRASMSHAPLPQRLLQTADRFGRQAVRAFQKLNTFQKSLVVSAVALSAAFGILILVYNEAIFAWLVPVAEQWRRLRGGWAILWAVTVLTAFPPMIGYSTCVTIAGFLYGFPAGWPLVATANVAGSLASFLLFRHLLAPLAARLAGADPRFAALARVLERDGFRILAMIRFCPLPYSLSNAALATFRSIRPWEFAAATALATPKLLIHVFVGSRLAVLAASGEKGLDFGGKVANWGGIALGVAIGVLTGWIIYRRTTARARELEAEEWDKVDERERALQHPDEFEEDDEEGFGLEQRSPQSTRRTNDDIDFLDEGNGNGYRDEPQSPSHFGEDEDAAVGLDKPKPAR